MPDAILVPTWLLDDPGFMRLPCRLKARLLELAMLAACQEDPQAGRLPDVSDAAWELHTDPRALALDLQELGELGWLRLEGGSYFHSTYLAWQTEWEAEADND